MSDFTWKLKQFLRKIFPLALIGALLYGGWNLYKQGTFRHGPKYAVMTILHKIPYFGSRFRHYGGYSSGPSYAYSGRRGHGYRRRHRRRHRR